MIDSDLIEEINAASRSSGRVMALRPDLAASLFNRIADLYVQDSHRVRWWESLKVSAKRVAYGDKDGLSLLENLVNPQDDCVLIVTDDEAGPWPMYVGPCSDLVQVLRSCRFFEYMLAAEDASWVIFDTHLNELLSVGTEGQNAPVGKIVEK